MKNDIVVTMKAFEKEVVAGQKQSALLDRVAMLEKNGGVELRRELMCDVPGECKEIRRANQSKNFPFIYSVPDTLFHANEINLHVIEGYVQEAVELGAKTLKLSTGEVDFSDRKRVAEQIKSAVQLFTAARVHLTIENDQAVGGKLEHVRSLLEICIENAYPVGHTFDTANWLYVDEDPIEAAETMKPYVDYIHLKDAARTRDGMVTAFAGKGVLDWKKLFQILPKDCPVGLEFQIDDLSEGKALIEQIRQTRMAVASL
ncbi:sugar phosphate isomerase/epimerase family protein [Ethanoligenens sp.]|uniref:sugar phosphate isomerase/epimerase family protein n=1 Tax=Ethanoligenens sp. TaxID=2099655 RepID=UPI0039E77AC1